MPVLLLLCSATYLRPPKLSRFKNLPFLEPLAAAAAAATADAPYLLSDHLFFHLFFCCVPPLYVPTCTRTNQTQRADSSTKQTNKTATTKKKKNPNLPETGVGMQKKKKIRKTNQNEPKRQKQVFQLQTTPYVHRDTSFNNYNTYQARKISAKGWGRAVQREKESRHYEHHRSFSRLASNMSRRFFIWSAFENYFKTLDDATHMYTAAPKAFPPITHFLCIY